ncbi:hypothetical protein K378_02689 [Streptomyces sp. Amel2xB2]|uniref:anti-sigma factor family protein n=1 Tax=Streptomyces sp. Amel2xB2 TaxID=1305829 RepID=UPI000DBA7D49|nr:hypothetical protein [Streptomyces sp. Amel2xB2]RAJ66520.1 hypothetical protein K378_02689 [Streptomyces sp. Amel2xB2]
MTSTPFTSGARNSDGHPDVAEISALTERLLPADRASELRAHLGACRLCADVLASLEEIHGALGALPEPAPMPDDVVGRIEAALAAEALHDPSRHDTSVVSRETGEHSDHGVPYGMPVREAAPHRHDAGVVSRETGATRRPADRPAGRPGGGSSGPGRHRPIRRTRRWRSALIAGAGAVVTLGLGGIVLQSMNDSPPPTAGSGPDKNERTVAASALEKHVHGLLAKHESRDSTEGSDGSPDIKSSKSPGNNPLTGGTNSVPSCVRAGVDRTETPLAVDEKAPYKGDTAYLVVLPHKGDPKRVDAYVVDPSCVGNEGSGPGDVLAKHTYTRH